MALCLVAAGCSKENEGSSSKQELAETFKALVMGGKEIDSLQTWNTVKNLSVSISVDWSDAAEYTVYILPAPALLDADAAYLGMARLVSGSSKTVTLPASVSSGDILYAACFDADDHAVCQPFKASASGAEVVFSGKHPSEATTDQSSTDARWHVPYIETPDLSAYTFGAFVEVARMEGEPADDTRLSISSDLATHLPSLTSNSGMVLYVGGTWTLTADQEVAHGNVIVVGNGGRIVIPEGITLSLSSDDTNGQIHVMDNGQITGNGTLVYNTEATCYNDGDISVRNVQINHGTLYNKGTIGTSTSPASLTCGAGDATGSQFINWGQATLQQLNGNRLALHNAGVLTVAEALTISETSRLSDNSYTECRQLTLSGSSNGDHLIYMGNAATLVASDVSIDNFGIWGPAGSEYTTNAVVKLSTCSRCTVTNGTLGTCLLDHVELILPDDFNALPASGSLTANGHLLYRWMNAFEGDADSSRQTCTYSTSPSFDSDYLQRDTYYTPDYNCVYYAFETPVGSLRDFDYNDVVLRVGVPEDRGDGTYVSNVRLMCVGNTVKTNVLLDGQEFGQETHAAAGLLSDRTVNVSTVSRMFVKLGELTFTDSNARIDQLDFSLRTTDDDGTVNLWQNDSDTPLFIVVNGSSDRRWYWPAEGVNIGVAYPQFSTWGTNRQSALNWYDSANAVSAKVVKWELEND